MIKVNLQKQSGYSVNARKLKKTLQDFFSSQGIVSPAEVSIAVVGEKKMLELSSRYLGDKTKHSVLSFTPEEGKEKFVYPPDGIIHLGEIIICYPYLLDEARKQGKLIDEVASELVVHSALHLMGIHHEK
jgi:probable rRNA maturation factor